MDNDLIFRSAAIAAMLEQKMPTPSVIRRVLQQVPGVDAESLRPKGRWVSVDGTESCDEWDCTACEQRRTFEWEMELEDMMEHYAYCPSCGAKMEG